MENKNSIRLELKEIVAVISLIASIVVGYFAIIKDFESRLVRLETKFEEFQNRDSNNHSSVK
jgi:uncharacterized protein (UPF0333 family)